MFIVYVEDGIFSSPISMEIDQAIRDIRKKIYTEVQCTLKD